MEVTVITLTVTSPFGRVEEEEEVIVVVVVVVVGVVVGMTVHDESNNVLNWVLIIGTVVMTGTEMVELLE